MGDTRRYLTYRRQEGNVKTKAEAEEANKAGRGKNGFSGGEGMGS